MESKKQNNMGDSEDDNPYFKHEQEQKKKKEEEKANGKGNKKGKPKKEDLYELLGVKKDASIPEIKSSYKKLALVRILFQIFCADNA